MYELTSLLLGAYYMPGAGQDSLHTLPSLILTMPPGKYYYLHFTDEKTEA